jgi:hypothetical protein
LTLAATAAINVLLPNRLPSINIPGQAGSPTYNTALSGNRAALNDPIPVHYGYGRSFPPFAADPYLRYDNDTGDQYYYALLCLGQGRYDIDRLELDDTDLDHFDDVQYQVLPPGTLPSLLESNIVTAVEVGGLPLNPGRSTPAVAACRGGLLAVAVEVDIVFPAGLGTATSTPVTNKSVTVRVDWRPVDNWGVPTGPWETLATETITAASTEPVRRSFSYVLGAGPLQRRPEVRLVRTTPRDENPLVRNDAVWAGLRAVLALTAPLAASATHVEVVMRATEQLNGLTQRRLAVVHRRLLHTWAPDTGWSADPVFTRNPAWAICDKLRSTVYGNALPDARIDLATFHALAQVWDARQDRLDLTFDTLMDSDEADQLMARAGRARCYWRNGVRTVVRDEPQTLPAAGFSARDMVPGSVSLRMNTHTAILPDAIVLEYFSHQSWDWEPIVCPAPGVTTPTQPEYMRLPGVTGAKQAEREGLYEAAARVKRRKFAGFTTELQGKLPSYGSLVAVSLPLRGWGQHGDVVGYDASTRTLVLSEPLQWQGGADHFITLMAPNGQPSESIAATEGADAYTVQLASEPPFDPVTSDAGRERTRYIFGATAQYRRDMLVLAITPAEVTDEGVMLVDVQTVNDDPAIHSADNALLPAVDEEQDPIDSPNGGGSEEPGVIIVMLTSRTVSSSGTDLVAPGLTLRMGNDGVLSSIDAVTAAETDVPNQWVLGGPIDPVTEAVLYEVQFIRYDDNAALVTVSGTLNTWLGLGTTRDIVVEPNGWTTDISSFGRITVQVREAATGIVQATCNIEARLFGASTGGG